MWLNFVGKIIHLHAEDHSADDCHKQSIKCQNCHSKHHYATSKSCEVYKKVAGAIHLSHTHEQNLDIHTQS